MLFAWYVLVHDILGGTLFDYCDWDSYTLQALAWRKGRLSLDENYSWLEIAAYNGNYYVSFPPVPSLVMLPLTFIFDEVPSNFVVMSYSLASVALAYKIMQSCGYVSKDCAFWSVVLVIGSNMMWMSTIGGVWFLAQGLNMVLCLAAVLCMLKNRRFLTYALLALAVGCRPFSAIYFPLLMLKFVLDDREKLGIWRALLGQARYLIVPMLIAAAYMAYNYARFDDPFEFGHNYLPEFAQEAQFSIKYLPQNLYNLFLRPVTFDEGKISFPQYDGFMFYIANPFYIVWLAQVIRDIAARRFDAAKAACVLLIFANILLLCIHRTLGGWQFGARYTVDMLPFALAYFALGEKRRFNIWEYGVGGFAVLFNVYGMFSMHLLY